MLLEHAEVEVKEGSEEAFAAAMRNGGLQALAACDGVVSVRFGRGVEKPSTFTFNVRWTSIEAHIAARTLDSFQQFRAAFGDLTTNGSMCHFEMDDELPGKSA